MSWTPLEGRSGTESPNSWLGSKTRGGEEGQVIIVFQKISIIFKKKSRRRGKVVFSIEVLTLALFFLQSPAIPFENGWGKVCNL